MNATGSLTWLYEMVEGPPGATGPAGGGPTGAQGATGPRGATGPAGPSSPAGIPYTPGDAAKWSGSPTTVQQALDRIAAVVGGVTPIP